MASDRGSGTEAQTGPARRPGLIRSIIHRLAGEHPALPIEGHLASFAGATQWLNSQPLTPEGLRGRVVLVDFWTYTCVNWLRTLPYVRAWAAKYADTGQLPLNFWDLSGTWTVAQHAAILDEPGGRVTFEFHARDVNLVMGPAPGNTG